MTADLIQLRDWDWLRPPDDPPRSGNAEVIVLPVVRVERAIEECRRVRKSLLGEP